MKNEYYTKDLHLAAFLQLKGCVIDRLDRVRENNKDIIYFIFADQEYCENLEKKFWADDPSEIMGNIKYYVSVVKELRSRIYAIVKPQ